MAESIRFFDLSEARAGILARKPWEQVEITPAMHAGIERIFGEPLTADQAVDRILADVRARGDAALRDFNWKIEGARTSALRVSEAEIEGAWLATPEAVRRALELAADRIESFHRKQPRQSWIDWDPEGGALGQIIAPLDRVAIYAPGGRVPYPSSLLMSAVPARVAGVPDVVVATPPGKDGNVAPVLLAAARVAKVQAVYKVGGAQAIAALSYGTESIPAVSKIVGPGNLFVVLAKRRVYGQVGIDGLPGPTETVVVADDSADPALVAADLLAQAEHDVLASPICITPSRVLAEAVRREVARQTALLGRREVIDESLSRRGGIVLVRDLAEAVEAANEYAPEHLCLLVADPWSWVGRVRNAGGVFVGETSSEALGDYIVGPSHIMPTGGTARWASPCNVWDFLKITSVYAPAASTAARLGEAAATLARAEGLTAHAAAIEARRPK
jgi:histidinol dehydrogenase